MIHIHIYDVYIRIRVYILERKNMLYTVDWKSLRKFNILSQVRMNHGIGRHPSVNL